MSGDNPTGYRNVNFALSRLHREWLRRMAYKLRVPMSQLHREALDDLMAKYRGLDEGEVGS